MASRRNSGKVRFERIASCESLAMYGQPALRRRRPSLASISLSWRPALGSYQRANLASAGGWRRTSASGASGVAAAGGALPGHRRKLKAEMAAAGREKRGGRIERNEKQHLRL